MTDDKILDDVERIKQLSLEQVKLTDKVLNLTLVNLANDGYDIITGKVTFSSVKNPRKTITIDDIKKDFEKLAEKYCPSEVLRPYKENKEELRCLYDSFGLKYD